MADEIQCVSCGLRFPPQNDHQGKMVLCPHCRRPTRNEPAAPSPAAANPYASPQAPTPPLVAEPHQAIPVDSPEIYRALAGTRPWALFVGVLGLIVGGIGVAWALWSTGEIVLYHPLNFIQSVSFAAAVFVVLLVNLGSWFSFQYGRRIGVFLKTQDPHDLERALSSQRSFWRLVGITLLAAIPILLVLALLVG